MAVHRIEKDLLRGFVGGRDRMHQPDAHALDFELMRLADPVIDFELVLMTVETLVTIAERGDDGRDTRQLVENAVHIDITGMHDQIDAAKDLEDRGRQMLASLGNMGVRNDPDAHSDTGSNVLKREPSRLSWRKSASNLGFPSSMLRRRLPRDGTKSALGRKSCR